MPANGIASGELTMTSRDYERTIQSNRSPRTRNARQNDGEARVTTAQHRYASPPCLLGELDAASAGYLSRPERILLYSRAWQAADGISPSHESLRELSRRALERLGTGPQQTPVAEESWDSLDAALADALLRIDDDTELQIICSMRTRIEAVREQGTVRKTAP